MRLCVRIFVYSITINTHKYCITFTQHNACKKQGELAGRGLQCCSIVQLSQKDQGSNHKVISEHKRSTKQC